MTGITCSKPKTTPFDKKDPPKNFLNPVIFKKSPFDILDHQVDTLRAILSNNNHLRMHHITRNLIVIIAKKLPNFTEKEPITAPGGVFLSDRDFFENYEFTNQDVYFLSQNFFVRPTNHTKIKLVNNPLNTPGRIFEGWTKISFFTKFFNSSMLLAHKMQKYPGRENQFGTKSMGTVWGCNTPPCICPTI